MSPKDILEIYSKMPMLPIIEELHNYYGKSIYTLDDMKRTYYQHITDINFEILKPNIEVYYVYGKFLKYGIISEILDFKIGYSNDLIIIKGIKKPISSKNIVIKK